MDSRTEIIIIQEIQFVLLLLIGFVSTKFKVFSNNELVALSKLSVNLTLPASILSTLYKRMNSSILFSTLPFLCVLFIWTIVMFYLGGLTGRFLKFSGDTLRIHIFQFGHGNMGAIGLPLLYSVLGNGHVEYITACLLVDQVNTWTLGNFSSYSVSQNDFNFRALKKLICPPFIALLMGILFGIANFHPPDNILTSTISSLGDANKHIMLIFLGGQIAMMKLPRHRLKDLRGLIVILLGKMIFLSLLIYWLTGFLPEVFKFNEMARLTISLFTALPSAQILTMLAKLNGSDYEYAVLMSIPSTILSVITIPFVSFFTRLIP